MPSRSQEVKNANSQEASRRENEGKGGNECQSRKVEDIPDLRVSLMLIELYSSSLAFTRPLRGIVIYITCPYQDDIALAPHRMLISKIECASS